MEERPVAKDALTREEISSLRQKLSMMSVTGLMDFYRAAYCRCKLEGDCAPAARAIQELVQAWRQIRKWR